MILTLILAFFGCCAVLIGTCMLLAFISAVWDYIPLVLTIACCILMFRACF